MRVRSWKCAPCRAAAVSRAASGAVIVQEATGQEPFDLGEGAAGAFVITSGRHRRFEGGRLVAYEAGDVLQLTELEAARMAHRVVRVAAPGGA